MRTSPESGRTSPLRILTRVDLPAPFSPTIARTSPVAMASETSSSATVASKRLERCSTTIAAARPRAGRPDAWSDTRSTNLNSLAAEA